jgi:hypothetical protein
MRDASGVRPRYLTLALSSGNRGGKTLLLDVLLLHATLYKYGVPPPDEGDERALLAHAQRRFAAYHFGISVDVAEIVAEDIRAIMAGTHYAQKHGCPLTEAMGKGVWNLDGQRGALTFAWHNMLGGGSISFRTSGEKAVSQLGRDMHFISFDECGFEPNLNFIVEEVLHLRRLSTGGQLVMVSTPSEGFNQWHDQWMKGDPDDPQRDPDRLSMRMSTRDNVGYGISEELFDRMVAGMPAHLVPQNIDGYFIDSERGFFDPRAVDACFVEGLPHRQEPEPRGRYVQGVDPALTHDATWSVVLKIAQGQPALGVLAQRKQGKQTVTAVSGLVRATHETYDEGTARCDTGLDTTGFGGKVFHDTLRDLTGIRQVEFGGRGHRKLMILTDLKGLIEQGKLRFPRTGLWLELRRQLLAYRLADRKLATDAVMALAVAARVMVRYQQVVAAPASPFTFFDRPSGRQYGQPSFVPITDTQFMGRRPTSTLEGWPPRAIEDWLTEE